MARLVWKRLSPGDLAGFRAYLAGLPPSALPVYGLLGVEASWWTRLGGGARPFVVLVRGDRIIVSKRSFWGHRAISRWEYQVADLQRVRVRRGPFLESARLTFADDRVIKIGSLPRRQTRPLERFPADGAAALAPDGLTPGQLTNTCLAWEAMGLDWAPPGAQPTQEASVS